MCVMGQGTLQYHTFHVRQQFHPHAVHTFERGTDNSKYNMDSSVPLCPMLACTVFRGGYLLHTLLVQDTDAAKDYWKPIVSQETRNFESEYDALMYGGIAITQASSPSLPKPPRGRNEGNTP